jgi:short-subunit dehydrogenase
VTRLAGAVAIVTGASRGIGRATADALTRSGTTVVAVGRDGDALAELTRRTGGSHLVADLRDPQAAERIVAHALERHGRLDAVVANAGVGYAGEFAAMPPPRIDELVDVNLRAPLLLTRAALPALRARSAGSLVFVSSIAGAVGVPGESVYSATKAGLETFAALLREELRGTAVTVSTVLPGVVDTGFFARRGAAYDRTFPRPMAPERIAALVLDAVATGAPRRIEPRWLTVPARLAATAPGLYRRLARRLG